jgi:putative membrane protein
MVSALVLSALFLISYLTYHHFQGDTRFLATGLIRPIYFFILISHIILSVAVLPMVLITVFHALRGRFSNHKKIARYTFPVWLYVSVTGVLVFLMLNVFNHAP